MSPGHADVGVACWRREAYYSSFHEQLSRLRLAVFPNAPRAVGSFFMPFEYYFHGAAARREFPSRRSNLGD